MTLYDFLTGLALALVYGTLLALALAWAYIPDTPLSLCTTDSECQCLDDCLEPWIQDEAQTPISQERN